MSKLNQLQRLHVAKILQATVDEVAGAIPDRFLVDIGIDDEIRLKSWMWTSAMTRRYIAPSWGLGRADRAAIPGGDAMSWEEAALPLLSNEIVPIIEMQRRRWATAEALGLVRDERAIELPPAEMMIDRTLRKLLKMKPFDLHRAADLIDFRIDDFRAGDEFPLLMAGLRVEEITFFARQEGEGPPVLCRWMHFGEILKGGTSYDGMVFALDADLPEMVKIVAEGRRLGEIVATGRPEIDERVIARISEPGFPPYGFNVWYAPLTTEIQLVPDLVKIGSA